MRVFLLDLWLDLREKKLAPLAIILLAAIVIVPLALAKSEKKPTTVAVTPAPAGTAAAATAPVIQSQPEAGPTESKLQTFSPRDPFEPTGHASTTTGTTGSSGGTGGSTTSTTTTTTTGTSTPTTTGGGGGAPTGSAPTTTGTPGTGGNTGNTTGQTKTTLFTYTVDLRFGEGGNEKALKGVKRLDLIPNDKNPKVVYLGVTTTGKTAVFLVDSNVGVDTAGGKCKPSPDQCTFLYLRPDSAHDEAILTDSDGTVYHMRLLAIHRVTVSSSNGSTNSGSGSGGSGNGTRSHAFTGSANRDSNPTTVPGGDTPPGEPSQQSSFQQFFADSGN